MIGRRERFVSNMIGYANDPAYGYSQKPPSGRWGPDYDCSSIIYEAANSAGYSVGRGSTPNDFTKWTGHMAKDFTDAGFQLLPFANVGIDGLEIGDILLNLALHAEVYVGDEQVAGAQGSETGGYVGMAGDQTGDEITIQPVYTHSHGWNYVLRPPDDDIIDVTPVGDEDGPKDISEKEGGHEMPMPYNTQATWTGQQAYPQYNGYSPTKTMPYTPQGNQQYNGYAQGGYGQTRMPSYGGQQGMQMPYNQQGYMQGYSQGGYQQGYPQGNTGMGLCMVNGVEEVANMHQEPGTMCAYFDNHKDVVYFKSIDHNGVPNITACEMHEIQEPMPQHGGNLIGRMLGNTSGQQISREEFDQLKEMMFNGQQQYGSYDGQQGMDAAATGDTGDRNPQSNGGLTDPSGSRRNGRN